METIGTDTANVSHSQANVSLWDVYTFAYFLAFHSLSWRYKKQLLQILIEPCNYWRNLEVPAILSHLRVQQGDRILDIGSPKLPSLFLWSQKHAEVHATDLLPYFVEEYSHFSKRLNRRRHNHAYHIEIQDARKLTYADSCFDKVYAISVIEHIDGDGDSEAMREIARVLKPGGICCLTVPFAQQYEEERIDPQLYHEFYYKLRDNENSVRTTVFWQRKYDEQALLSRLIYPSGLTVCTTELYGERWFRFERFYTSLPSWLRVLFSVPGPLFSLLFLYKLNGPADHTAKTALLVLRKGSRTGKTPPQVNM